jgi:hypothetical protein
MYIFSQSQVTAHDVKPGFVNTEYVPIFLRGDDVLFGSSTGCFTKYVPNFSMLFYESFQLIPAVSTYGLVPNATSLLAL